MAQDIFTILYEVGKQQYVIGVTNAGVPKIAAMGVNTDRPLPQNIKKAMVDTVKELKELKTDPKVIDYNAPSTRYSKEILNNWSLRPGASNAPIARSVAEAIAVLKAKMQQEG